LKGSEQNVYWDFCGGNFKLKVGGSDVGRENDLLRKPVFEKNNFFFLLLNISLNDGIDMVGSSAESIDCNIVS